MYRNVKNFKLAKVKAITDKTIGKSYPYALSQITTNLVSTITKRNENNIEITHQCHNTSSMIYSILRC